MMAANPQDTLTRACPDEAELHAFHAGKLPETDLESVAAHVGGCPRCLNALQRFANVVDPLVAEVRQDCQARAASPECGRLIALVEAMGQDQRRDLAPTMAAAAPVRRLGPYELLALAGQGGMGSVWKAQHVHLGKIVALKLLPAELLDSDSVRHRFSQEMKAVGRLSHRHIVQAYDAAVEGEPYLAMEYVEGLDLARVLRAWGPLGPADACELIRQAALGLQHAHEHGLVHRDIKPSNLMLTSGTAAEAGVVKILDLGLARLALDDASAPALTAAGAMMGTPDYMAPEQLLDASSVDIRADVYSLGCSLYQLLVGETPFSSHKSLLAKRQAHLSEAPPPLASRRPDVPVELASIVARMLAKEPGDRLATPAEVAAALQPFCAGSLITVLADTSRGPGSSQVDTKISPAASTQTFQSAPARKAAPLFLLSAILLAVIAVAGLFLVLPGGKPAGSLRVARFELQSYRLSAGELMPLPAVGSQDHRTARLNDMVRVTAEFNVPAHCYLIAFNSNGAEQLCYPPRDAADRPPAPLTELRYPDGKKLFQLNDGVGLQAFVLIAAQEPLPPYAQWRAELGPLPWQSTRASGSWRWDGMSFEPLGTAVRGTEVDMAVPAAFADLCQAIRARSGADAQAALAFPIAP